VPLHIRPTIVVGAVTWERKETTYTDRTEDDQPPPDIHLAMLRPAFFSLPVEFAFSVIGMRRFA